MILKHEIDNIFLGKIKKSIPEPTPCWEWIVKKFKEKANELDEPYLFSIFFCIYKDGRVTYSIESNLDRENIDDFIPIEYESEFSESEIMACGDLAAYNLLSFTIIHQPENSECKKIIDFEYSILSD